MNVKQDKKESNAAHHKRVKNLFDVVAGQGDVIVVPDHDCECSKTTRKNMFFFSRIFRLVAIHARIKIYESCHKNLGDIGRRKATLGDSISFQFA